MGVGIHTVTSPQNISLSLFLEHWAPGIDTVQMFLSLHICFKKIVLHPKQYHTKTLFLIPFSMKLLLA